jgi:hypothetical protein
MINSSNNTEKSTLVTIITRGLFSIGVKKDNQKANLHIINKKQCKRQASYSVTKYVKDGVSLNFIANLFL